MSSSEGSLVAHDENPVAETRQRKDHESDESHEERLRPSDCRHHDGEAREDEHHARERVAARVGDQVVPDRHGEQEQERGDVTETNPEARPLLALLLGSQGREGRSDLRSFGASFANGGRGRRDLGPTGRRRAGLDHGGLGRHVVVDRDAHRLRSAELRHQLLELSLVHVAFLPVDINYLPISLIYHKITKKATLVRRRVAFTKTKTSLFSQQGYLEPYRTSSQACHRICRTICLWRHESCLQA